MSTQRDPSHNRDDAPVRIVAHRLQQTGGKTPLPADTRARPARVEPPPPRVEVTRAKTPTRLRQVVLVDRDVDALRDVAIALRDQFDFHVTISGNEALTLLQSGAIDVIVVGQTLYSSTGMNVLAAARRRAPNVQRVLLANAAEAVDIERESAQVAPFHVLQRPFTPQKLLDLLDTADLEQAVEQTQEPAGNTLKEFSQEPPTIPRAQIPVTRPVDPAPQRQPAIRPVNLRSRAESPVRQGDFEHVVLETLPDTHRRQSRRAEARAAGGNLPIVVYTDSGDFYHSVCLALQDEHEIRLATQLENAVEMAEMGLCPVLITDRAGTQTELQRISIALRATEPAMVTIASGSPSEGLALRKLLNTPALHAFLPKPLSAPLVRLTVEAAKRQYVLHKMPAEIEEHAPGNQIATPSARPAPPRAVSQHIAPLRSAQQVGAFQPNQIFERSFEIEERFDFRRLVPYAGMAALALVVLGAGGWYWQQRSQSQARSAVLIDAELDLARKAYDAGDYVTPENANALYFYRRVLKRDAAQAQALQGIDNVVERLIEQTEKQLTDDKLDAAAQSIALLRELRPDHKRIEFLDGQVRKANSYRQAQQLAEQSAQVARNEEAKTKAANARLIEQRVTEAAMSTPISNATQRSQATTRWLTTAHQRMSQGKLVAPESDSAEYYFRLAERTDPNNSAVEQGLRDIGAQLLADAQDAVARQQLDLARRRLADAGRFGPDPAVVARIQGQINSTVDSNVRGNFLRLALQRTRENALFEPAQDSAKYYLSQLQRIDSAGAETQQATRAIALKLIDNANQASAQKQFNTAIRLLDEVRRLGFNGGELTDANNRLQLARTPPAPRDDDPKTVPPPKVIKSVPARFPDEAIAAGVSGWVDVGFKINASGDVYDAVAMASNPPGPYATKFERAAVIAISQYKFEPRNIAETQTQSMVVRVQFKAQ